MRWKHRGWTLIGLLLTLPAAMRIMMTPVCAQVSQIATTTVTDTVYRADGTPATGTVIVSWQAFTNAAGQSVPSGSTSATIGANGAMSVALVPNAGSTPMGTYYTAVYHLDDGTVSREFWVVPVSASPVQVSAIKTTVLPTSVAMQTVSKSYVDTAIAAAVSGHPLDTTNPYVLKAGDTMTGPLVLPGDPTAPTQAADKNYVDASVTGLTTGLAQKVSTIPAASQTVTQPTGTDLHVNHLNGTEYAGQYVTGLGDNGIANALTSPDCTSGCDVKVEHSYNSTENYTPSTWTSGTGNGSGTHVEDDRDGQRRDTYLNPVSSGTVNEDAGQVIDVTSTRNTAAQFAATGGADPGSYALILKHEGLTGGTNDFPANIESVPYFKTNYGAMSVSGTYNAMGQHSLDSQSINCYGVGDCLIGSQFINDSGGFRDEADEGAHPYDIQIHEDSRVFAGTCSTGCTTGSTSVKVAVTSAPGTEGEGRYLIDKNPSKIITTGQLTGGTTSSSSQPAATATFTGTSFPVSVFVATAAVANSQSNNIAPGTVTLPIETTGAPAGFATSTAALPASSGLACVAEPGSVNPNEFELASYSVVDDTHLQLTLEHVHRAGATVAVGGLCGYGLEQTVDTTNGIRQVFPVIGSYSSTGLYYAAGLTPVVGQTSQTSGYMNVSLNVASIARSNNVVTVTTAGNMPMDLNGLTLTVAGVADSSYNGSFVVTTTGPNTLTYADTGANSTSTGGTIGIVTGGYVLYPMAEVLSVFDAATKTVDGQLTLGPNIVAWAAGDPVEEPHYYQVAVAGDIEYIGQTLPRPTVRTAAGIQYQQNIGVGVTGWSIENAAPASFYYGNGGTHLVPPMAYEETGIWQRTMSAQAGEQSVFSIHCNSHGCGKWNSGYNLFELDSNAGVDTEFYQPLTSTLTLSLRGTAYSFTPQAFTAGTINAGTINATTINGAVSASQLPVFGASGAAHAEGAVPDPGATSGTARYLREDGTWDVPSGSTLAPANLPERTNLLGEYLLNEGTGTVAEDTSGKGNNGVISGATWEGTADLSFVQGDYIQLPTALNQTNTFQFVVYIPPMAGAKDGSIAPAYGENGNPSILCGTDTAHTCLIPSSLLYPQSQRFMAYNTSSTESQEFLSAGWHVVTFVNGIAPDKDHWYYDGAEVTSYVAQGSGGIAHPATGNYQIGGSNAYSGTWWAGKVAAAWAWSTALPPADVAAAAKSALDYATAKGAIQTYRVAESDTPLVIGGLDSRTYGAHVTTPWIDKLTLTDSTYTPLDLGVSGLQATDAAAMFDLMYGPYIHKNSAPVIVALWGGINDMANVHETTQQLADALHSMVRKAKADGARVILATEIDATGDDAKKDALDAIIRQQAFSWGVDNVADLATIPQLGADGASASTTYFADGLHPVDAGETLITSVMSNAVNELIGSTETNRHTTAAATYQEVAGDRFLDLTGTTAQAVSLPDCIGYSLPREIVNLGTAASTVATVNAETLAGSGTIAVNARALFVPVPGALATGGCHWERTE
ncbi:SGNH/GDSL hydrolase family protein [Edaphobacter sp.]|uniref:SGNH/GDSL hydrolase family protein n=1 Tax=Edaphobacter sp. TaxID=1934404 RepID=UPI002DB6E802|nr:SGNH/GDSL hydrolase family protein [Edaphobacter sp.]HEU5340509.1 SGNH/GDSL hydrolase family protein [Edaphobacter sp.]